MPLSAALFLALAPAWAGSGYNFITGNMSGAQGTYVYGVNDNNRAVGYYVAGDGTQHGFMLSQSTGTVGIQYPGSKDTAPFGINNSGVIVGSYDVGGPTLGFILQSGHFTTMGRVRAIANYGLMLIGSQLYDGSVLTPLPGYPGATTTAYRAINSSGAAAGFSFLTPAAMNTPSCTAAAHLPSRPVSLERAVLSR